MGKDWQAVANAINTRLEQLDMTQQELATATGVSPATLREIQHNKNPRRRSPRTLAAISTGLNWPSDHLSRVLEGQPTADEDPTGLRAEVDQLKSDMAAIRSRVEAIETDRQ